MINLEYILLDWQKRYLPSQYLLALSGGLDSVVLLHLLSTIRDKLSGPVHACHINHGWHMDARIWSDYCALLCKQLDIPFSGISLNLPEQSRTSREAQARIARYAAFRNVLSPHGVLLTAHHQNDQAETLLLQLLRGSGVAGLAAMPERQVFSQGEHWRPLLSYSRHDLYLYAQNHGLQWIDDPSNDDKRYTRNLIRHEIMPVIQNFFPSAHEQIARSAGWLAETQDLLNESLDIYLDKSPTSALSWSEIAHLSDAWQRAIIRRWLQRQNIQMPNHQRLFELVRQLRDGSGYAELIYAKVALIFYRKKLWVFSHQIPSAPPSFALTITWEGVGQLSIKTPINMKKKWQWTLYPPGGQFQPIDKQHHKPLKHWFQQANIPPYLRQRTPLLWCDGILVWVGGIGCAADVPELAIDWKKPLHSVTISPTSQVLD